jgi:dGTPase
MVRAVVEVFDRHYDEIMNGSYHVELIYDKDCRAGSFVTACKELLRDRVFCNDEVLRLEVRGRQVIHDLMKLFWEGARTESSRRLARLNGPDRHKGSETRLTTRQQ